MGTFQRLDSLSIFHSKLVDTEPPSNCQLLLKYSYWSWLQLRAYYVPSLLQLSHCDFLYLPVCVSGFQGNSLPSEFNSLMDLRRAVDFQAPPHSHKVSLSVFLSFMRTGVMNYKLFKCWIWLKIIFDSFWQFCNGDLVWYPLSDLTVFWNLISFWH